MNKFITSAVFLAAGTMLSNAYSVTLDDTYYKNPNAWVYIWNGSSDSSWGTGANWSLLKAVTETSVTASTNNTPTTNDPVFIGYDFSYENGVQVLTANDNAISVSIPAWASNTRTYLGKNVVLTGTNNGFGNTVGFDFGDFSGTSKISMGDFWMQSGGVVNFSGTVTMTEESFSYDLFVSSAMQQVAGTWNSSGVSVTDANGKILTYTDDESLIGQAGYYWLETSEFVQGGEYKVTLCALQAIPEPSAFGLLAGVGALALVVARRRRSK